MKPDLSAALVDLERRRREFERQRQARGRLSRLMVPEEDLSTVSTAVHMS
jgi:hypothetical protein